MTTLRLQLRLVTVALAAAVLCPLAGVADWDEGDPHKMHYPQLPEMDGWDVSAWNTTLADDWTCSASGPVTGIHFWVSWQGNFEDWGNIQNIHLSIHEDIPDPDGPGPGYSSPSNPPVRVYDSFAGMFQWNFRDAGQGDQGWFDPIVPTHNLHDHNGIFQINCGHFVEVFTQEVGKVYWLDVKFDLINPDTGGHIGWKTSRSQHHLDDAVYWDGNQGIWQELLDPTNELESLDLAFVIQGEPLQEEEGFDFGDAPDGALGTGPGDYETVLLDNGAYHWVMAGAPYFDDGSGGDNPDSEPNGQQHPNAMGDDIDILGPPVKDDEDGIVFTTQLIPGNTASVQITVDDGLGGGGAGQAYVDGWVDFNRDGDWVDSGELIQSGVLPQGPNVVNFPVPAGATLGQTFARFRITSGTTALPPTGGPAIDGEVEDHEVQIEQGTPQTDAKWLQPPDLTPEGFDVECIRNRPILLADDYSCTNRGAITNITIWGSWLGDEYPIRNGNPHPSNVEFTVSIHSDMPAGTQAPWSMPGPTLWVTNFGQGAFHVELDSIDNLQEGWYDPANSNWTPNADWTCWRYTFPIPPESAFVQTGTVVNPVTYWVDLQADPQEDDPGGARFGWKTTPPQFQWNDDACWAPALEPFAGFWWDMHYPPGHPYHQGYTPEDSFDLAFALYDTPVGDPQEEWDYGDAPEGAIAYPSLGVNGAFPTCKGTGPAGWVQHGLGWARFTTPGAPQPVWDQEPEGNAGNCPLFTPNMYDQDECMFDGDAGLLLPAAYTITGPLGSEAVTLCPNATAMSLGNVCQTANWGANVDINIVNVMPVQGYVNVLMDWDQNGAWGGSSMCPAAGPAPEHVLVNWPVFSGYTGPLSGLGPPGFLIGPNSGYVWCRFTISEQMLPQDWNGAGGFEDGETEDYLLEVEDEQPEEEDWGDAPATYPTMSGAGGASHLITAGGPWLGPISGDSDPDGQPDPNALGDDNDADGDDEDGVTIPSLTRGRTSPVTVQVSGVGGGWVEMWIDFDASGSWDASEKVADAGYAAGPATILVSVPSSAPVGQTFARVRINGGGAPVGVGGQAADGEVEDYEVFIVDQCPKWVQPPDCQFGLDMQSWTNSEVAGEGRLIADDWFCDGRPIVAIDWWGSYLDWEPTGGGNQPPTMRPAGFLLTWYTDIPADKSVTGFSMPKAVLKTDFVTLLPYGSNALGKGKVSERIFCTNSLSYLGVSGPTQELEYAYHVELTEPWLEKEGNIYWLSVQAVYPHDPAPNPWGWKTTATKWNWLDDAVHRLPGQPWEEMIWMPPIPPWDAAGGHPYEGESVNMAFRLLTDICPRRCKKWAQPPDMIKGVDMESWRHTDPIAPSYVLRADDFISDGRPITDIHWWGSYSNWYVWVPGSEVDPVLAPTSFPWRPLGFQISWHTNDSSGPGGCAPASPALYTNFVPMRYCHEVFYGTVTQHWMQPVPPAEHYYEHEYQYYIDLLDPEVSGEAWLEEADGHYWLDIQAVFTNAFVPYTDDPVSNKHAGWGWKTTTNITQCVSMFSLAEGIAGSWQQAFRTKPENLPVDLSFELTTTNVPSPGSTNNWLAEGPFQFTDMWLRQVQVMSNGTPVPTDEWWLYSQGECGCGKQVLQLRSNLVKGIDWVDIATNYVPRPLNIWTVPYDEPVEFYRIRFEN